MIYGSTKKFMIHSDDHHSIVNSTNTTRIPNIDHLGYGRQMMQTRGQIRLGGGPLRESWLLLYLLAGFLALKDGQRAKLGASNDRNVVRVATNGVNANSAFRFQTSRFHIGRVRSLTYVNSYYALDDYTASLMTDRTGQMVNYITVHSRGVITCQA